MSKKVYLLTELMRSSKSGFFIQGTDISMDYPDAFPLPMETEVIENGVPVALRLLPTCGYLEREKQLKAGFPATYKYTQKDRSKLTFTFRRLELDTNRDKLYIEYIERAAWMAGNEDKKVRDTTKTIYEPFDEDVVLDDSLKEEALITKAKTLVFDLEDTDLRNMYRLSNPGKNEGLIQLKQMRKHLLDVCAVNPTFIINGIKTNYDKLIVLVSRALEVGVLSLDYPGAVAIFNDGENQWQNLISVADTGGPEEKLERLVEWLSTDDGAAELAVIEHKTVEKEEAAEKLANPPQPAAKKVTKNK